MTSLDSVVELDAEDLGALAEIRAGLDAKLSRLRDLVPCILDMSFREATLSSRYGHTLADKIELYELAREFGFTDFGLSNFYDFPSVTDQFLDYLLENDVPLEQFLVTIAVELGDGSNAVVRSPAVVRTEEAGITNIILLVEIRPSTVELSGRDRQEMLHDIDRYIRHYRAQLPSETEQTGRIYIRMADIFDAFDDDPNYVIQVLKLLGASPITGILYEDVCGSRFTFESNALVRLMRRYVPQPRKILAHPHSGNGMEDAATIEAVRRGGGWRVGRVHPPGSAGRTRLRPDVPDQPDAGRQSPRATSLPTGEARGLNDYVSFSGSSSDPSLSRILSEKIPLIRSRSLSNPRGPALSNSRCRSRRHFTKQPDFAAEPVNSNVRLERDHDKQSAAQPCAAPNSRAPLSVSSAYRWQAVQCPGSTSARGGVSARQRSSA